MKLVKYVLHYEKLKMEVEYKRTKLSLYDYFLGKKSKNVAVLVEKKYIATKEITEEEATTLSTIPYCRGTLPYVSRHTADEAIKWIENLQRD